MKDVMDTVSESRKKEVEANNKTLEDLQKAAEESGNSSAAYLWEQQLKENKESEIFRENVGTVIDKGSDAALKGKDKIAEFVEEQLEEKYDRRIQEIDRLLDAAKKYAIPPDDMEPSGLTADNYTSYPPMASTDSCYLSPEDSEFAPPKTAEEVVEMLENLASGLMQSSFMAFMTATIDFIKAMLTVDIWMNPQLNSSLRSASFSSIGGLPSKKDRSVYPLNSPYESVDKQQSDYYKAVMGSYSSGALNMGSVNGFMETIDALKADITSIGDTWKSGVNFLTFLEKLGTTLKLFGSIIKNVILLLAQIVQVIATAVYGRLLLAGYLGYNTANRTTYSESALTGQSFNLPEEGQTGKCFYGAETEYIILGNESEIVNQIGMFYIIYLIRLISNLPVIFTDGEVSTIAEAAGSVSFGVATPIVYALYIIAEPLVDTLILVNGGSIALLKKAAYLTPSGVESLVKAVTHLKMTEAQTTKASACLSNFMSGQNREAEFGQLYARELEAAKKSGSEPQKKDSKLPELDYTSMLILVMLFMPTQTMVERLGDIIQMEAVYNGHTGFDLDKSYTYLRASGSFSSSEFIRLSDNETLNSTKRVVYRGY